MKFVKKVIMFLFVTVFMLQGCGGGGGSSSSGSGPVNVETNIDAIVGLWRQCDTAISRAASSQYQTNNLWHSFYLVFDKEKMEFSTGINTFEDITQSNSDCENGADSTGYIPPRSNYGSYSIESYKVVDSEQIFEMKLDIYGEDKIFDFIIKADGRLVIPKDSKIGFPYSMYSSSPSDENTWAIKVR